MVRITLERNTSTQRIDSVLTTKISWMDFYSSLKKLFFECLLRSLVSLWIIIDFWIRDCIVIELYFLET